MNEERDVNDMILFFNCESVIHKSRNIVRQVLTSAYRRVCTCRAHLLAWFNIIYDMFLNCITRAKHKCV